MKRRLAVLALWCLVCRAAAGQGVVGDALAGKLVKPEVGQWAWYDLTDTATGSRFVLRLAIVGKEKVAAKTAHWIEFELVPTVGYKSVCKMLLTGPANDPKNVHRTIFKHGVNPAKEVPSSDETNGQDAKQDEQGVKRKSLGTVEVKTLSGVIRAEHFEVTTGDQKNELWINNQIKPMGIVRLVTAQGELLLRTHGVGGEYGKSILDTIPTISTEPEPPTVEVEVGAEGQAAAEQPEGDAQ